MCLEAALCGNLVLLILGAVYEHASDSDFEWDLDPSRHQRQQPRPQPIPQERPEPRRATEPTSKQSDYLDNEDGERPAVRVVEAASEEAIANQSDLQLVFFGTSARQSTAARSISVILDHLLQRMTHFAAVVRLSYRTSTKHLAKAHAYENGMS